MVNELLEIKYNIAKANATDRKVQNLASYINVEIVVDKVIKKLCKGDIHNVWKW